MELSVTLSDGTTHAVDVQNPDRIRYDKTRNKHKWPNGSDAPFLMMTFFAWAAMTRTGTYSSTWEQFSEHDCIDVDSDDADEAAADPTQPTVE